MNLSRRFLIFAISVIVLEILLIAFVDRPLSEYMHGVDTTSHGFVDFFRAYTTLGLSKWYLWPLALSTGVCALLVRMPKTKEQTRVRAAGIGEASLFLFACVAISGLLTDTIKYFVGRARPVLLERDSFYGFHPMAHGNNWHSWPSGHSTTAFALAYALFILLPRAWGLWLFFAVTVALSRIIVNAHYLSDIIAGSIVGTLTVYLIWSRINHDGINHIKQCFFPIDRKRNAD